MRPFIFGPIEFVGLNQTDEESVFDAQEQQDKVINNLERTMLLPQNLCIHGFKVKVKLRNLKRRTSLLKHARFLRNLEVYPILPEIVEEEKEEGEEDQED